MLNNIRIYFDEQEDNMYAKQNSGKILDNTDQFGFNQGAIHMYQSDISGQNAIDQAFKKNAVFCIKAFVETLIILTDEVKFRNCFDKALLMMISKGMDVKELVSSELFFATIWKNLSLFSSMSEPVIIPYNDNVEDLDFEDPNLLFTEAL